MWVVGVRKLLWLHGDSLFHKMLRFILYFDALCGKDDKLMSLEIKHLNLKFLDNSNFVASPPITNSPKLLALKNWKGLFSTSARPSNEKCVRLLPNAEYYVHESVCNTIWTREMVYNNYVLDFEQELHVYCDLDLDILRRGCLELRNYLLITFL